MANKNLFKVNTVTGATVVNDAGGIAYEMSIEHALAQYACTGTFNGTYYVDAATHLERMKELVQKLRTNPEFVAKVAVYSRKEGYMKDMPAYLCAVLACWGESKLFRQTFDQVIDNVKMLRNFIQIGRSGQAGKVLNMSSGSIRKAINAFFERNSANFIFRGSIGNDPNMRDVLRMSHPKPNTPEKAALFAYLKGAKFNEENGCYETYGKNGEVLYSQSFNNLPQVVKDLELFKKFYGKVERAIPDVDFRLLDSFVSKEDAKKVWAKQASTGAWHMLRMNLNNFQKYGVFDDPTMVNLVAAKLSNKEEILRSRVFPYQIMNTYMNARDIPHKVRESLQDAMEIAIDNVPEIEGQVYVLVDVSFSMSSSVTNGIVPSVVRCVDVAGLFASAILRRNRSAEVIPFAGDVKSVALNGRDTVLTNAKKLSDLLGGGTDCSKPLKMLNDRGAIGSTVIYVSDNESWMDSQATWNSGNNKTGTQNEWNKFKGRNPNAKLICIDITPRTNSQVQERKDILQVGGFSDNVFDVISSFLTGKKNWIDTINEVSL